jgi:hypothetical protein
MFIFCGYCARESRWDTPVVGSTVTTGWHPDPFGVHEARYFSADGQATKLVRDRGLESYDEPPSAPDEVAAAMARMSAVPVPPSAYASRAAYQYDRAPERDSWRPSIGRFAVTWVIAVAAAVGIFFAGQALLGTPKPASTPGGAADVAFVTQAATRTLQQHTVELAMSASGAAGSASDSVQATGAFDLGGKAGTLNMTIAAKSYTIAYRTIYLNGYAYVGVSVNGVSLLPAGKTWIAEQQASSTQGSGTPGLTGVDPTAELASLQNQGITVSALGTKDIGGVSCTGYAVTEPGPQNTVTVWINQQHLVREISVNTTVGLSVGGSPASAAPTGTTNSVSVDLTMDFTYSAAPVHVTAPPAGSTISYDAFLQQLATNPALKRLEPSSGAS